MPRQAKARRRSETEMPQNLAEMPQHLMYFGNPFQLLLVLLVVVLLFGKGKISDLMGDVAKGIKSFKKGMADESDAQTAPAQPVQAPPAQATAAPKPIEHEAAVRAETKAHAASETKA
jgi:sec-independent protein translocase protein TatA